MEIKDQRNRGKRKAEVIEEGGNRWENKNVHGKNYNKNWLDLK